MSFFLMALMLVLSALQLAAAAEPRSPADADRGVPACVVAPRPNSLWSLAQCCASSLKSDADCRYFSQSREFIILKDNSPRKPEAYLIIPTIKVTGIEDKQIFDPPIVDFWEYGWRQGQRFIDKPAADSALAINSAVGRTQDQLHIHISCVLPAVARSLANNAAKIGSGPAKAVALELGPNGNTYRVFAVTGLAGADSPFTLVADLPGARADMADQSVAVIGSATPGLFYVLDTRAAGANRGAAEELLDQYCGGLRPASGGGRAAPR